jgi:hypothetical protein
MHPVLLGQIRHVLTLLGGVLVAKGYGSPEDLEIWIGLVLSLGGALWSWREHRCDAKPASTTPACAPEPEETRAPRKRRRRGK